MTVEGNSIEMDGGVSYGTLRVLLNSSARGTDGQTLACDCKGAGINLV